MNRRTTSVLGAALLAGSALAFDPWGWQPFGPSKWTVVTTLAFAAAGTALWGGVRIHGPSGIGWLALLGWAAVTSVTAIDPVSAWLGTPDRRLGFVALATMAAAFVAGQALSGSSARAALAKAATVALLGMGLYGLLEVGGFAPVDLDITTTRLGSTFGSPAYLGAAVALLLPVAVGVAADRETTKGWRVTAGVATVAGIGLLAGSATRAALVGLVAAGMVILLGRRPLLRRPVVVAGVLSVAVALGLSPLGERILNTELGEATAGRTAEWRVAADALARRPLLGAGLEGYRVVFPEVVDAEYVRAYGRSTVTDRAHSAPLDLGTSLGLPGGLAWLVGAAWLVTRSLTAVRREDPMTAGLAAGMVAYLAQELFLFPTIEMGVGAWLVAGSVVAAGSPVSSGGTRTRVGALLLWGLAATALVAGGLDMAADHRAGRALRDGDLAAAQAAASLRPDSFRYRLVAAETALIRSHGQVALAEVEAALALSPRDPALRLAKARLLTDLAVDGLSDLPAATNYVAQVVETDPNQPAARLWLGTLHTAGNDPVAAEQAWLAAEHLSPGDPTPALALAELYAVQGQTSAARAALARAAEIDPGRVEASGIGDRLGDS